MGMTAASQGVAVFVEVGKALAKIRDGRLYRETHATFEAYCAERWGWSRVRAHQLIESSEVAKMLTMVNTRPPATERTARPRRLTVSTVRDIEGQDTPAAAQDARGAVGEGRVGESPPIHLHRLHRGRQECRGFGNATNSRLAGGSLVRHSGDRRGGRSENPIKTGFVRALVMRMLSVRAR